MTIDERIEKLGEALESIARRHESLAQTMERVERRHESLAQTMELVERRHESLAHSVELLSIFHHEEAKRNGDRFAQISQTFETVLDSIKRLENIARSHEQRISDLEDQR